MIAAKITRRRPAKRPGRGGARPNSGGARKGAGRPRKPRFVRDYEELGPAPADELDVTRWMYRGLAVSAREVMTDKEIQARERRSELRAIAKAMVPLLPKARLRQAEMTVRGDADKIASKVDPEVEAVPDEEPVPKPARPRAASTPSAALEPVPPTKEKP